MTITSFVYAEVAPERTEHNFTRTYTGRMFWPLNPHAEDIDVLDVAHHLSNECRFNGATYRHYSVAQHAVLVSHLAARIALAQSRSRGRFDYAREIALWGLHHDDSEAYLRDMIRPIKKAPGLGDVYKVIERRMMVAVIERFDLTPHEPSIVKIADEIIGDSEGRDLVRGYIVKPNAETLPETIVPLRPEDAEAAYLRRHYALINARSAAQIAKELDAC